MATATWTGAIGSDYTNFHNWMSGFVPGDPDTATFGSATSTAVTIAADRSVDAWQFTGGSYTNTIAGSTSFSFKGAGVQVFGGSATIEVGPSAVLSFDGPSDGGTAAYVVHGVLEFNGNGPNGDKIVHLGSLQGDSAGVVNLRNGGAAKRWSSVATIFPPLSPAPSVPAPEGTLSSRSGPAR